jgi:hypothetical protein
MITLDYLVGALFRKRIRYELGMAKLTGSVEGWVEYKSLLDSRFAIKATPEFHKALSLWMRKVTG